MDRNAMPVFVFGCLACGKTVAGNEKSCPRCGASFEDVRFECPFCGELISPSDSRCGSCGTEFSAFSEDVSETASIDLDGASTSIEPEKPSSAKKAPEEHLEYECPNCGKPVGEQDTACPHCGASFTE